MLQVKNDGAALKGFQCLLSYRGKKFRKLELLKNNITKNETNVLTATIIRAPFQKKRFGLVHILQNPWRNLRGTKFCSLLAALTSLWKY